MSNNDEVNDSLWEPLVRVLEFAVKDWTANVPQVTAIWVAGMSACETMASATPELLDALSRSSIEERIEFHHVFARRMVIRFERLAAARGAQLQEGDIAEWYRLIDEACAFSPGPIDEDRLLDAQFLSWFVPNDTSFFGPFHMEPALVASRALSALGLDAWPTVPPGSLPANRLDDFYARGGQGGTPDLAYVSTCSDALLIGMHVLPQALSAGSGR